MRDRQSTERVADDDRVRLSPDGPRIVERSEPDLVTRQIRRRDVMTVSLELLGNPAEAPATMPSSVHEYEPRHGSSIQHLKGWARP